MEDLFEENYQKTKLDNAPLAERMRPESFQDFFGQDKLIGEKSPLRKMIQSDRLPCLIFWGPPGSGKTSLARIIAKETKSFFVQFSAVTTGINKVRKAIAQAQERLKLNQQRTILFLDEIHRFNKAQQDALLPYTEDGTIILIGATTENPSFEIIAPLLSRSAVFVLEPLSDAALQKILQRALKDNERGLGSLKLSFSSKVLEQIIRFSDGDARVALNALEFLATYLKNEKKVKITPQEAKEILKKYTWRYDKKGDSHYDIISAFIKSLRDSDPNGALYWLARMLEAGEDPKFIARRMIIFASEDIGNADPRALEIAVAVARAVEFVGLPEAQINLAQGVTYLATAPKNNASYQALLAAKEDAKKGAFPVPLHLRNAATALMKKLGYGRGYQYAHDFPGHRVKQNHFPKEIGEKKYYFPKEKNRH